MDSVGSGINYTSIYQYIDLNISKLSRRIEEVSGQVPSLESTVTSLLADHEKKNSEKVETMSAKLARDNAELRTVITSLQAQVSQLKMMNGEGRAE